MKTYYTYDETTKVLTPVSRTRVTDAEYTILGANEYAKIRAYPMAETSHAPEPPEGKIAILDGYELVDGTWSRKWRFDNKPLPTLQDFDNAMEAHLKEERAARGYTTREPDSYLTSSVPRWRQDAEDWVAHRDEVMEYALELMNAVKGGQTPPTLEEFTANLPVITWTYEEEVQESES